MTNKYGIISLRKQFPTDDAILDFIFGSLHSRECSCGGIYRRMANSRRYQCSKCRFKIAPTAGTIFHKSETPLTLWFHAILVFSNAKSGVSAAQLQRELEVTYKTAWRMLHLIRKALAQGTDKLSGDVEMDSSKFGGVYKSGKYNRYQKEAMAAKSTVMGAAQRGGIIRAEIVPDESAQTHGLFLDKNIEREGTRLMTDKTNRLNNVAIGYDRHTVHHRRKEWVRGDIHVNTIETFWAHVKRSLRGVNKVVSKKYLQSYLDGFVWHHNNAYSDRERFASLLGTILHA